MTGSTVSLSATKLFTFVGYPAMYPPSNVRVDTLARHAYTSPYRPYSQIPAHDYFPVFKSYLYGRWQSFWSALDHNKLRTVKLSVSPWQYPFHGTRRWETALARLRIGHTHLKHSFLMACSTPTTCSTCGTPLSVKHLLLTCPLYAQARRTAFPHLSTLTRTPLLADILPEHP